MAGIFVVQMLAVVVAAPGMFILGLTNASLLGWTYRHGLPFAPWMPNISDEVRLIRTSLDLTYGTVPVVVGVFIEVFSLTRNSSVSPTVFWLTFAGTLAYLILYYQLVRPKLTSLRLTLRNRVPIGKHGS
jgi:hypothetical protein